jgi:hypothetical protein
VDGVVSVISVVTHFTVTITVITVTSIYRNDPSLRHPGMTETAAALNQLNPTIIHHHPPSHHHHVSQPITIAIDLRDLPLN